MLFAEVELVSADVSFVGAAVVGAAVAGAAVVVGAAVAGAVVTGVVSVYPVGQVVVPDVYVAKPDAHCAEPVWTQ